MKKKRIKSNLKQILDSRGLTQKDLALSTGIREATISKLCRNTLKRYPKDVLEKIMNSLNITDVNELLTIEEEKK